MTKAILQSQQVSRVPGISLYVLTKGAVDVDGIFWPIGTEYTPRTEGFNGLTNSDQKTVVIKGKTVTFERRRED